MPDVVKPVVKVPKVRLPQIDHVLPATVNRAIGALGGVTGRLGVPAPPSDRKAADPPGSLLLDYLLRP